MGTSGRRRRIFARGLHGGDHLGARHGGDAEQFYSVLVDEFQDASGCILFKVAVDDLVLFFSFQRCRKGEDGKWKPAIAGRVARG